MAKKVIFWTRNLCLLASLYCVAVSLYIFTHPIAIAANGDALVPTYTIWFMIGSIGFLPPALILQWAYKDGV